MKAYVSLFPGGWKPYECRGISAKMGKLAGFPRDAAVAYLAFLVHGPAAASESDRSTHIVHNAATATDVNLHQAKRVAQRSLRSIFVTQPDPPIGRKILTSDPNRPDPTIDDARC